MKKRVLSILSLLLILPSLVGCFNYREINKITFVTSVIFDKDEYDNVQIYLDCVSPYRNANESSDKGKRLVLQGTGKTALEAMRDVDAASSNIINFSQVRAYIFTEDVAVKGIDKYINLIDNNQEFGSKTYMFTYYGDVEALLNIQNNDEEYLGLYLDSLIENNKKNINIIFSNVSDYITSTMGKPNISLMSSISIKKDIMENKVLLNGATIMQDNHLIKPLEKDDVVSYNLLTRNVSEGTFQVTNPNDLDKFVTLDILESSNYNDIKIVDDKVLLTKNINIRTSIGEVQGKLDLDYDMINIIKREEEYKLKRVLEKFFESYKKDNIDILKVERLVKERFATYDTKDILNKTELDVNIDLVIDGSSLVSTSK